jgi:hypothetical protein
MIDTLVILPLADTARVDRYRWFQLRLNEVVPITPGIKAGQIYR